MLLQIRYFFSFLQVGFEFKLTFIFNLILNLNSLKYYHVLYEIRSHFY